MSLHQPWATAIAIGLKKIETRGYGVTFRSRIAIHAAQRKSFDQRCMWDDFMQIPEIRNAFKESGYSTFDDLPFGALIATVQITDSGQILGKKGIWTNAAFSETELILGNYDPGRHAWRLESPTQLPAPVPFKGHQGWFTVPDSLIPNP